MSSLIFPRSDVVFKEIPGFVGYFASSDGFVWSHSRGRWLQLRHWVSARYPFVGPFKGRRQIKRSVGWFVALAFHGAPPKHDNGRSFHARHLDGNPFNNIPSNLAWGTASQNQRDVVRYGGRSVTVDQIREIRRRAQAGESLVAISWDYGIDSRIVGKIIYGEIVGYVENLDGTPYRPLPKRCVPTQPELRAKILYDHARGLTVRQIAKKHKTTKDRVWRSVKKAREENRQNSPLAKQPSSLVTAGEQS